MKVQDVLDLLVDSELSKHAMLVGGLNSKNTVVLIRYLNQCLVDLYSRYPLKINQLTLIMNEAIAEYPLRVANAVSDATPSVDKYIYDSKIDKFTGDVIQITNVIDEACYDVPLNDRLSCYSIMTPQPDVLYIPNPLHDQALFVSYRAYHPKVENATDTLELPDTFVDAVCSYIGYRLYAGSTEVTAAQKSSMYYAQYENNCNSQRLNGNTNNGDGTFNDLFYTNGWV